MKNSVKKHVSEWETQRQIYGCLAETQTKKRRVTGLEKSLSLDEQDKEVAINDTDLMSGQEVEQLVAHIMNKMGYTTRLAPTTGDRGVDIIAEKNEVRLEYRQSAIPVELETERLRKWLPE